MPDLPHSQASRSRLDVYQRSIRQAHHGRVTVTEVALKAPSQQAAI